MTVTFTKSPAAVYGETNPVPSEITQVWTDVVSAIDDKSEQSEIDALTATVGAKASQTEVDTLTATVGEKASQTDLNAFTRLTTGSLVQTANLLNPNDADYTIGSFVRSPDGLLPANPVYDASGYVPVEPSTAYYVEEMIHYAFYDANKVFISGDDTTVKTITSPATAAFLRLTVANGASAPYVVAGSSAVTPRPEYGSTIDPSRVTGLTESALADNSVTAPKVSFFGQTRNLFDKNAITADKFMGADGTLTDSDQYFVSDFIPVEASTDYFGASGSTGQMRFYAAFDSSFNVVLSEGSNTAGTDITSPSSGVAYYRFTGETALLDLYQFEAGTSASAFVEFGYPVDSTIQIPLSQVTSDETFDKLWTSFGDSTVNQNTWQPLVSARLGLDSTTLGVGGRRISGSSGMCQDAAVNTIGTDCQVLTVLGGINDWANSVALGTESSTDTDEFYGALNQLITKLEARLPNTCRIVFLTPTYAEFASGNWEVRSGFTSGSLNGQGLTVHDYGTAIKAACLRAGYPVIDLAGRCGVNTNNVDDFSLDDGNHLHPGPIHDTRISSVVSGELMFLIGPA